LRAQLAAFPALHPAGEKVRRNPFEAVLLTNADLDHTLGLLLMREGEPLHLHAARSVRAMLSETLGFEKILATFCGIVWHELAENWTPLSLRNGAPSGLVYRALPLRSAPSAFSETGAEEQTMAFLFKDEQTGGVLLLAPDVFEISAELEIAMQSADAILFDGTFWSEDELGGVKPSARAASRMGHLPVCESLAVVSQSPARHRIYMHINNTNPLLQPAGAERAAVEKCGIAIGTDGLEFEL